MNAAISGAAGVALVLEKGQLFVLRADAMDELVPTRPEDQRVWLGEARDIQFLRGVTMTEIRRRLVEVCDQDDALHLALGLLDPELSEETRTMLASELEETLESSAVRTAIRNIFHARPCSAENDVGGAIRICKDVRAWRATRFFEHVMELQPVIAEVWDAWQAIPDSVLHPQDRSWVTAVAVHQGLFRVLVMFVERAGDVEELVDWGADWTQMTLVRNRREIILRWIMPFRRNLPAFFMTRQEEHPSLRLHRAPLDWEALDGEAEMRAIQDRLSAGPTKPSS